MSVDHLLLEDGTSHLLLENGVDTLFLESSMLATFFLFLETGDHLLLEDGVSRVLLEAAPSGPPAGQLNIVEPGRTNWRGAWRGDMRGMI